MKIEDALEALKRYKRLGVTEVLIPRDFAPGGDFTLKYIPTPEGTFRVAWVEEIPDAISELRVRRETELNTIDAELIAAGFEYPRGAKGVKDVIKQLQDAWEKINELEESLLDTAAPNRRGYESSDWSV